MAAAVIRPRTGAGMETDKTKFLAGMSHDKELQQVDYEKIAAGAADFRVREDSDKKTVLLKDLLHSDLKAADLKWSFFVSACYSYKCDSCSKPFPPMYIKNENKDIEAVRTAISTVPPLPLLLQELDDPNVYENYGTAIDLLYWVLVTRKEPQIKSVSKKNHQMILSKAPSEMQASPPNLIFSVTNKRQSECDERWKYACQGKQTFFAYHGSQFHNFHSIIHHGLQQNMCKETLFGKGIYLSSELGVSLPYSSSGHGWGGSVLGGTLSCVALCELLNDPDVKRGDTNSASRATAPDSIGGKIPNKYYLVRNSEMVRVRYLLVYCQEVSSRNFKSSGVVAWFKQHKLLTFVLSYVVLLASVGLIQNKQVEKYYRLLIQKAGFD